MEITLEQATSIKKGDDGRGKLYFYGDIVSSYWGRGTMMTNTLLR